MGKITLDSKGMGLVELLFWVALAGLLGWAVWQLYLHPESLDPKGQRHGLYEDTH